MLSTVRFLNWLVLIGSVVAFAGSFIMVADQWWAPFSGLLNRLSGFGRADEGWRKLNKLTYKDAKGKPYGRLQKEENGFEKILEIIGDNHPGIDESQIAAIIYTEPMTIGPAEEKVPVITMISLRTQGESTTDPIATAETVKEWITRSRLRFVLFWGFLFLSLGFFLGLPRYVFEVICKNVN